MSASFSEVKKQIKTLVHLVIMASHLSCDRPGEFMRKSYRQFYSSDFIIVTFGFGPQLTNSLFMVWFLIYLLLQRSSADMHL